MSFITGILQLLLTLSVQRSLSRKYAQINKNCEPAGKTLCFWNAPGRVWRRRRPDQNRRDATQTDPVESRGQGHMRKKCWDVTKSEIKLWEKRQNSDWNKCYLFITFIYLFPYLLTYVFTYLCICLLNWDVHIELVIVVFEYLRLPPVLNTLYTCQLP